MPNGKLEARITIPSGGYAATVTDSGGADASAINLVADSTYYWSAAGNDSVDLAARIQAQLNASVTLNGTYTVTVAAGEGGNGKLTIACDESFTVTWTNTELRDLLGYSGNVSSTTSAESDNHVQGLWISDCPTKFLYGADDDGTNETDAVSVSSPRGDVISTVYNRRTVNTLEWMMVQDHRARTADETVVNESFQTFFNDGVYADEDWSTAGGPVRWYQDADTDATNVEYYVVLQQMMQIQRANQDFSGYYTIQLPRLVKVPS